MNRSAAAPHDPASASLAGVGKPDDLTVVIGGGISGLTVAFRLHEAGRPVIVLESRESFGGVIRTHAASGWLFEEGPNTVVSQGELDLLIRDLGLKGERLNASPRAAKRFVVKGGVPVPLPSNPFAFLASSLFTLRAKLRVLKEPIIPPFRGDDECIADFTRRRLGSEFLDYAVGPFVSGVYAGDPEKLSVRHAVRKIHALEANHGSLIRGAIALRKAGRASGPAPRGTILSFQQGLDTLPRTIARRLGPAARPGTAVEKVRRTGGLFEVRLRSTGGASESIEAARVIVALDALETSRVLESLDTDGSLDSRRIADIPYAGVAVAGLGYRREDVAHPLDGFGLLVPKREGFGILGCLFTSTLFPGRAPEGRVALTVIAGGATDPGAVGLSDEELLARITGALRKLLGVTGEPEHVEITRWPRAIPQYNLGHQDYLDIAANIEARHPGLHLIGNWRQGVSVGDCVQNAAALARQILEGKAAAAPR